MNLSPEQLSLLLDNSVDAVLWMSLDRQYLYVSPACADLTGHAPAELSADPGLFVWLPVDPGTTVPDGAAP